MDPHGKPHGHSRFPVKVFWISGTLYGYSSLPLSITLQNGDFIFHHVLYMTQWGKLRSNKQDELEVPAQSQNYDVIGIAETGWELACLEQCH